MKARMSVAGLIGAPILAGFEETRSAPMIGGATIPAGSWIANARFAPALDRAPKSDLLHADGRVAAVRIDRRVIVDILD